MDPDKDPGGPKTYGTGCGSATLQHSYKTFEKFSSHKAVLNSRYHIVKSMKIYEIYELTRECQVTYLANLSICYLCLFVLIGCGKKL